MHGSRITTTCLEGKTSLFTITAESFCSHWLIFIVNKWTNTWNLSFMRYWRNKREQKIWKVCHFLTNRKRPFLLLANKRASRIMNLVASDWINSRAFVSRFDLFLSPLPFCYCEKQMDVRFSCVCPFYWQWISSYHCQSSPQLLSQCYDEIHDQ